MSSDQDWLRIAEAFARRESATAEEVLHLVRGLRDMDATAVPLAQETSSSAPPNEAISLEPQSQDSVPAEPATETLEAPARKRRARKPVKPTPAVPIDQAVTDDEVTCLECGRSMRMLKRHLGTVHNITPDDYRTKWGLPEDFPITAPNYSSSKSKYAKTVGLGVPGSRAPRRDKQAS